jgi:hypothetical protein
MERLLGDLEMASHLLDRLALSQKLVGFGQFAVHLLGPVTPILRLCCPPRPILDIGLAQEVDQFTGIRSPD